MRKHSTNTKFIFNNSSLRSAAHPLSFFLTYFFFVPLRLMPSSQDISYDNIYFVHGRLHQQPRPADVQMPKREETTRKLWQKQSTIIIHVEYKRAESERARERASEKIRLIIRSFLLAKHTQCLVECAIILGVCDRE